jgi:hypothetical protein
MPRPWKPILWFTHVEVAENLDRVNMVYGATGDEALFDRRMDMRITFDAIEDAWRLDVRPANIS